jgi:predicted enzyme related to lactoylglutathione lyase
MTTDVEGAQAFYTSVMGWSAHDASLPDRTYILFTAGEAPVSGMMNLPESASTAGGKPCWVGYVGVEDADAAADRIKRLGGAVHIPPTDIPNISRFSVFADPQTATLALLQSLSPDHGQAAEAGAPGRVSWHELFAADWERALAFYSEVFGWQKARTNVSEAGTYQLFSAGGQTIGGMLTKPPMIPVPFWLYYFNIDNVTQQRARDSLWRSDPRWSARSAGRQLDRAMRGSAGRHVRAGGKARPQHYRIFRAHRIARSSERIRPAMVLVGLG